MAPGKCVTLFKNGNDEDREITTCPSGHPEGITQGPLPDSGQGCKPQLVFPNAMLLMSLLCFQAMHKVSNMSKYLRHDRCNGVWGLKTEWIAAAVAMKVRKTLLFSSPSQNTLFCLQKEL